MYKDDVEEHVPTLYIVLKDDNSDKKSKRAFTINVTVS